MALYRFAAPHRGWLALAVPLVLGLAAPAHGQGRGGRPRPFMMPSMMNSTRPATTPAQEGAAAQLALVLGATTPTHPAHGQW